MARLEAGATHYHNEATWGPRTESGVRVEIFDSSYGVDSDQRNDEHILELASYLDTKMREVRQANPDADVLKITVVAALNMADELFVLWTELFERTPTA
jgi:cell division protein ZapA (FtsZ GTPase activity inhibitor)